MSKLFAQSMFDAFEVRGVSVTHFIKLDADGALTESGGKTFATWARLKPYIYHFIKGDVRPEYIKIVFSAPRGMLDGVAPNAAAAFLNMEYKDDAVRFTTATSQKEFSLSKEQDGLWDKYARKFFLLNGVAVEEES